ncbi:cyclic lactone autoinducer peptide [Romboutsia maritimum]|uniref:Cyclic lactone autoinducer peptide n=1 Tax=Romboutsia maritimum TaxID=2020948 RepID=A0A371IWT2_9FIRM|nr:cyclic lactone autoinducer peptide [Romboutsia maritimum]RDY24932.1 cyclic lactone autoinducer peptide [Romboutsia maritimum]
MDFLINTLFNATKKVAGEAATLCMCLFYEPEVPESLRED